MKNEHCKLGMCLKGCNNNNPNLFLPIFGVTVGQLRRMGNFKSTAIFLSFVFNPEGPDQQKVVLNVTSLDILITYQINSLLVPRTALSESVFPCRVPG